MGWTVGASDPCGGENFRESAETHPASSTTVTVFSAGRVAGEVAYPPPPLLCRIYESLVLYLVLPCVLAKLCHVVNFTIT